MIAGAIACGHFTILDYGTVELFTFFPSDEPDQRENEFLKFLEE
ncbi:hypothetical protein [Dactylococcopsis salina]|uniref:Uncharacterized protein n=1 Tax=Dactylococcopsis salina (strain PCC 8305) TaxID=13035 RepID=K9YYA2_DACS8|nr:hypothetical protein [Dactylococcopsis salina]AFZ51477.1 hypothetical protein Dacsa_2924 [Dactylococcopsis salina PCC 8305]